MIHEVPDPQPVEDVKVTRLTPQLSADSVARMTMEDYVKVRHILWGPAMVEWEQHLKSTGSLT